MTKSNDLQNAKRIVDYCKSSADLSISYRMTATSNKDLNNTKFLYRNYLAPGILLIEYDGRMYKKTKNWYTGA